MVDFKSAAELLELCGSENQPISAIMRRRECGLAESAPEMIEQRMWGVWSVMKASAVEALVSPKPSIGGLIGGEARLLHLHHRAGQSVCGDVLSLAMTYAMAILEVNSSMGLIVAAPTAGSAGVVPGVLLALQESRDLSDERILDGLFNSGAIGYLAMRNATVAGAVGGCQAEVGVAASMAASAAVEMLGGSPVQCLHAASNVLMNMIGLVCDPINGLVESPCQGRNASGAANALIAAESALSGITQLIPFDEMLAAMNEVGRHLPRELRETGDGGCAATPSGRCHGHSAD